MSKIVTEAEWLGKMLLKVKDVKTEEDLKNFKGLGLLLKSLIAYNCYNLVYEIKDYFLSLGISKETVEKYGRQYFHEGYLENCQWHYNQELKTWKEEKRPKTILQKIFNNMFKTNDELISMSEKIGHLLFKVARFTKDDFENDPGYFELLLKGLFNAGCKNLIFEIKAYFISLGISEEILNERGGMFFDEYLIGQHITNLKGIDDMI